MCVQTTYFDWYRRFWFGAHRIQQMVAWAAISPILNRLRMVAGQVFFFAYLCAVFIASRHVSLHFLHQVKNIVRKNYIVKIKITYRICNLVGWLYRTVPTGRSSSVCVADKRVEFVYDTTRKHTKSQLHNMSHARTSRIAGAITRLHFFVEQSSPFHF